MAAVVAVCVVSAEFVFAVGVLDYGEELVVLSLADGVVIVQVFPAFQGQGLAVLAGRESGFHRVVGLRHISGTRCFKLWRTF